MRQKEKESAREKESERLREEEKIKGQEGEGSEQAKLRHRNQRKEQRRINESRKTHLVSFIEVLVRSCVNKVFSLAHLPQAGVVVVPEWV